MFNCLNIIIVRKKNYLLTVGTQGIHAMRRKLYASAGRRLGWEVRWQ